MTRLIPALAAGVTAGVMGMRESARIRREASDLARWEAILRHLALLLRESAYALPEAMEQAAEGRGAPDMFLREAAKALREQPLAPLEAHRPWPGEGQAALSRWMARLGHGSLESRCQATEDAAEEIRLLCQAAREKAGKDAKMWTSLGWCAGTCLFLMLI